MKSRLLTQNNPPLTLLRLGLGLGLLLTALTWVFPSLADSLFNGSTRLWLLLLTGASLASVAVRLRLAEPAGRARPRPLYLLAVLAATALVYLFPELFAPGCKALRVPRAFAACPPECRVTTCTDWDAPGENGCDAKPPNKGCCRSSETTCAADCEAADPGDPPPPTYQPPTISGAVTCTTPGTNGWCQGGANLALSASDPQGFATTLTGEIAGTPFLCAGPTCTQTLPVGNGSLHYQASAPTSGQASRVGTASFAYDPNPPTAAVVTTGVPGANGWYLSAIVSTTGTDATSGIATTQVAVEGSAWQTSVSLAEGLQTVLGRSIDQAGNTTLTAIQTVKVDATAPTVSASITSGTWVAGWYVTEVTLAASASDATSGVSSIESRLDGGAWLAGNHITVSMEGPHTVDFRATDRAGLRSTTSINFQLDQTPPVLAFAPRGTLGAEGWYLSPVTLVVQATDPLSGVAAIETRLNGGDWQPISQLTFGEGEDTLEARATDNAGNLSVVSAAETIGLRVDTTSPALTITLNGKTGLAGWYVSEVTVSGNATDTTSGVALTEYRLDGGNWQTGTRLTVAADGPHNVDFRATDRAGNQALASRAFKIDQTLPISKFVLPTDGSNGVLALNLFPLEGQATDATSGLALAQISTDNGQTWLDLAVSTAGHWHTAWETRPFPNGLYPVRVRAQDRAGNIQNSAQVILLLANQPPQVSIQESWWVWEAGRLSVQERFLPLGEIRLQIACLDGQPEVRLKFTPETLPTALHWDHKCGQGQLATSGNHRVTLTACDQVGNCASTTGVIKVPMIAPPVPTLRPTQGTAWTPRVTAACTTTPTAQPGPPTAIPTRPILPTPLPPVITPVNPSAPTSRWLWPPSAFFGLALIFGLSRVVDRRPAALERLRNSWQTIVSQNQEISQNLEI